MPPIIATDSCRRQHLIFGFRTNTFQAMLSTTKDDFAARLNQACDSAHPPIPHGRGRRAELRRR